MTELLPLLAFAVAASVTPGPNNMMVAANAAQHGLAASVPHMLGIGFGFSLMILLVGLGLGSVLADFPLLALLARVLGVGWLLLLAWRIAAAPPPGAVDAKPPIGLLAAMLFQWINPKGWMIALSIAATWISHDRPVLPQILLVAGMFLLVGFPSNLVWALLGRAAAPFLNSGRRFRAFSVAMALLILLSMAPALLG